MFEFLKKKEKIKGTVIDFGFNKNGKSIAMLQIDEGNLYALMEHLKNNKKIGFTLEVPAKPEEKNA